MTKVTITDLQIDIVFKSGEVYKLKASSSEEAAKWHECLLAVLPTQSQPADEKKEFIRETDSEGVCLCISLSLCIILFSQTVFASPPTLLLIILTPLSYTHSL